MMMTDMPATFPVDVTDQAGTRDRRTWPATLTLFLLAGITAETLTGSTPILIFFINPFSFIFNPLLYGCGALLIREVARRRNLGWASIFCMGAAYGTFEEGLVINTWANPWAPQVCSVVHGVTVGFCDYSRVAGINLLWAVELTVFHAIVSIVIPILLVDFIFPQRAGLPWLGRKAVIACVTAELFCLAIGILLSFVTFRQHGETAPLLLPYLIEVMLMALFISVALTLKPRRSAPNARKAPRLWLLRSAAFVYSGLLIILPNIYQANRLSVPLALSSCVIMVVLASWLAGRWSRSVAWNARHMLALAAGMLGFYLLLWDPLLEIMGQVNGTQTRGESLVALVYLIGLIVLARRTSRRVRQQVEQTAEALPS